MFGHRDVHWCPLRIGRQRKRLRKPASYAQFTSLELGLQYILQNYEKFHIPLTYYHCKETVFSSS